MREMTLRYEGRHERTYQPVEVKTGREMRRQRRQRQRKLNKL